MYQELNPLGVWTRRFVDGLLIFCLVGIVPLSYFDAFSPDHSHPFHLSYLNRPDHHQAGDHCHGPDDHHHPVNLTSPGPINPLPLDAQVFTNNPLATSGLIQFFQSSLSHGFLLTVAEIRLDSDHTLFGRVSSEALVAHSACLLPPEKPPSPLS